ncbi:MAG TPA: N-6 DNA methylase, partial [Cyclobacteriaceae bacterium]|nr:N-6 DNA methylase [Cyclobacteriaceae bacterium]
MKYALPTTPIPAAEREGINTKVLQLIASENFQGITAEDIFQAYTGDGGLHGLDRKNYSSYSAFSSAKKECESGQFFTPPSLCHQIVDCIPVSDHDLVADLTMGMGNFFNFLPVEQNVYGCELEVKAYKVASFLYPAANLVNSDIRYYRPEQKFDIIFGNPPFNLNWKVNSDEILSQLYFLQKSGELLTQEGYWPSSHHVLFYLMIL